MEDSELVTEILKMYRELSSHVRNLEVAIRRLDAVKVEKSHFDEIRMMLMAEINAMGKQK